MAGQLSLRRLLDLCGGVSALAYLWLAWASHSPPVPLLPFFGVLAIAWCALIFLFLRLRNHTHSFPLRRMILWCLLFRVIGFVGDPVLEDDYYRYLWDGRSFAITGSPYGDAPANHFDDPAVSEPFVQVLDGINNPDIPTLYPPVAQYLFLVGYWIAPGDFAPIKLMLILADLGTLLLLLRLIPARNALLYAWCPLLIQETAFTGHVDILGVFFLVAAMHAYMRKRSLQVAIYAAMALATKLLAILVLPFLLFRSPKKTLPAFAGTLTLLYLPLAGTAGLGGSEGLTPFLMEWEFNSMFFALLAQASSPLVAKFLGAACVGGLGLTLAYREIRRSRHSPSRIIPRGDLLFACLFLFAPVINPWYLLWLLPFICAYPSIWGLAALASVSLSYVHGLFLTDGLISPYHHPAWVRPAELVFILLCAALGRRGLPLFQRVLRLKWNAKGPKEITLRGEVRG